MTAIEQHQIAPLPLLLRVSEVQRETGMSRAFVYKLISTGELPSLRLHRSVRVESAVLLRWIAQQAQAREAQR